MDMLALSLNAVIPLFLLIFLGYFLKRVGFFSQAFLATANKLCFRLLMPVNMFWTMYSSDGMAREELGTVAFCILGTMAVLAAAALAVPMFCRDDRQRGVLIQDMFRGNFVIYGTSVCLRMFGDVSATLVGLLTGVMIPVYNFCAGLVLSYYAERNAGRRISLAGTLLSALKNPMFWAPVLGAAVGAAGVVLPAPLATALQDLGRSANPVAQVFMGGSFTFAYVGRYWKMLAAIGAMRQVVIPGVMVALAAAMGFTGYQLGAILCMFGAPVAVTTFAMTQQYGGDADLAVSAVVVTTCFSCVSLCAFSVVLGMLGLL